MNPNIEEPERRLIRDAMARLLDGDPIRSDGKLTVKSLAAEAGLKRWYLTQKHTDLRDEFYDRVRVQGTTPAAMTRLYEEIATLKEAHKRDRPRCATPSQKRKSTPARHRFSHSRTHNSKNNRAHPGWCGSSQASRSRPTTLPPNRGLPALRKRMGK